MYRGQETGEGRTYNRGADMTGPRTGQRTIHRKVQMIGQRTGHRTGHRTVHVLKQGKGKCTRQWTGPKIR